MSFNPLDAHLSYDHVPAAAITKSNTVDNLIGARYIYVTGNGNLVLRMKNGDVSVIIPVTAGQFIPVGRSVAAMHSTGTSATGIAFS